MDHSQGFEQFMHIERGRDASTIQAYLSDTKRFRAWLDARPEKGLTLEWAEVEPQHVRAYLAELQPSPSYFQRIHSSLKAWFDYLHKIAKVVPGNPTDEISKPKKGQRHPETLSLEEVRRLIKTVVDTSRPSDRLRNWTLIAFLVNTGLRIAELCAMDDSSIRHREGLPYSVTVIGKGNKERTVILSENARTSLHQWMKYRRDLLNDLPPGSERQAIWIIPAGARKGKRMSPQAVRKMLKKYGAVAGIQTKVHPHKLRHTFATEAVRGGAKLHALRDVLGHARLDTTGIYLHADEAELAAVAAVMPDVIGQSADTTEEKEVSFEQQAITLA